MFRIKENKRPRLCLHVRCNAACAAFRDLQTQIKLFSFLYWDCLRRPKYLQGRPGVGAHSHTPLSVCARVHHSMCFSCCVSGCGDSRNLAVASLSLSRCSTSKWALVKKQTSYSSWVVFFTATGTEKWSFPSILGSVELLSCFPEAGPCCRPAPACIGAGRPSGGK